MNRVGKKGWTENVRAFCGKGGSIERRERRRVFPRVIYGATCIILPFGFNKLTAAPTDVGRPGGKLLRDELMSDN